MSAGHSTRQMSSKAKNPTPSKGQKDLFSFFKKPANNQSPPSDASKSSNGIISSQGSINLDVSGKVEDRVSPVRASTTPTTVTEGSTPRSSQVFGHKEKAAPDAMDEVISGYANQADVRYYGTQSTAWQYMFKYD